MATALQPNRLQTLLSAVTATGASVNFAVPASARRISWQTAFNENPAAVNITLRTSLDGTVWNVLDTSTAVGGEMRTKDLPACLFISANLVTNTGDKQVTVTALIQ